MSQSISQKFTPISLLKFALPSMVMMMFMSCYTIVDGIFISRYLGSEALSAANIVYPVFNLLLAVGIMFATGGSAVVSKKLGEGKKEEAMEDFSFLTAVGVALSVLLMIATLLFHNQISLFLGSSERILDYCNAYLIYLVLFAPACMLQSLYQSFFVTAGKPRLGLVLTVIAGLANAFFDYFFLADCGKADTRIGFNDYRRSYQCHFRLSVYGTYGNGRDWSGSCNRNWTDDSCRCRNRILFLFQG